MGSTCSRSAAKRPAGLVNGVRLGVAFEHADESLNCPLGPTMLHSTRMTTSNASPSPHHTSISLVIVVMLFGSIGGCKSDSPNDASDASINIIDANENVPDAQLPDGMPPGPAGIDILFVIDNSGSMNEEQISLSANFSAMVSVLENIEGGLPDLQIGVVSTDVGAGPLVISTCVENGDDGRLQNIAVNGQCSPPSDRYISDRVGIDGVTRLKNYSGTLAETFSCIARLGITGCGFEQPLESMRRALNGSRVENAGFLRNDAYLAVVIISDEDDCSVEDVAMFDANPALGPLSSFRCFEFGVSCEPDTPRVAGARSACGTRANSTYTYDVSEYVAFLKGLKLDPSRVIVAGIIGNTTPVSVSLNGNSDPRLDPSCTSAAGSAVPGVRLQAFLDGFPGRNTSTTICNDDLSGALTIIADLLAEVIVAP